MFQYLFLLLLLLILEYLCRILKNLPGYTLYYSDTDSAYFDKELPNKFIGSKLGQFKLERIFERGIFLAPKMYGGVYFKNGIFKELVKIKGVKNPLAFINLYTLLFKNKDITIVPEKWFRDVKKSSIQKKQTKHSLKLTSSKREMI